MINICNQYPYCLATRHNIYYAFISLLYPAEENFERGQMFCMKPFDRSTPFLIEIKNWFGDGITIEYEDSDIYLKNEDFIQKIIKPKAEEFRKKYGDGGVKPDHQKLLEWPEPVGTHRERPPK